MWDLLKVAFRNVGRNRRRSLITMLTVFIGVVVVTGTRGLLNGLQGEIKSGLTRKIHGDLQIHKAGYQESIDSSPYKIMFPMTEAIEKRISTTPGIEAISPRLRVMAMLNHQKSQTTTPVMVQAYNSSKELQVCSRLGLSIVQGELLDSQKERQAQVVAEEDLEEATGLLDSLQENNSPTMNSTGYHQLLVTPSLLKGLGAQMGDEVVLLLQDKNNMQQAVLASITGVVDYALPTSQTRIVWMDSATLASRLATNNEVSEIVVKTQPGWELEPIQQELQHRLGGDLIVETYLEVAGFFKDVINIQNSVYNAILFVVFAIVISAIVNTSLMTVMERVREIGTLMALGYRRKHILFLFLCESAFIGLTGGLAGLLFIRTLLWILSIKGLRFPLPGERIPTIFYPFVELPFLIFVLILAVTSALVASFFPAYRSSRMKPVDALAQT